LKKKRDIRVLISGAGTGTSGNVIRALRVMKPKPKIIGINHDRFVIKQSLADRDYLCPEPASSEFVDSILEIIKRERINVVIPTDDSVVKALSDARDRIPIDLRLPRRKTIDLCQDKYALNVFLRDRAVPVPLTYEVRSLRHLRAIFARFSRVGVLWCRARRGSRSLAATPVTTEEQARAWIMLWRDLQGVEVSDFTLGEYLPGRHFIVQTLWHNGRLLCAQSVEVLSYFAAGNNPSGTFSLSCLAKTVVASEALQVTLSAVRALERYPSGTFCVELKETTEGAPLITEINVGRFPSGVTTLLAIGNDNMIAVFASAAVGHLITVNEPYGSALERYLVRDIDAIPGVYSVTDLAKGVYRVGVPSTVK
jgi:carbamoyl-phosphate synthase large subunit